MSKLNDIQRNLMDVTSTWRKDLPVRDILLALCETVDSPVSLGLWMRFNNGEILDFLKQKVHPSTYLDVSFIPSISRSGVRRLWTDRQCAVLLAKYPGFHGVTDTKAAAVEASLESELRCSKANDRIQSWLDGRLYVAPEVQDILLLAQKEIERVLGVFDPREWQDNGRFGPGVTVGSSDTSVYDKLQDQLGVNPAGYRFAQWVIADSPAWRANHRAQWNAYEPLKSRLVGTGLELPPRGEVSSQKPYGLKLMDYGKRSYVPKTALTDRPIEVQPGLSAWLQSGIGAMIRSRLRENANCDLDHGWEKNQSLAKKGSLPGRDVVTVDLKAASDSVCFSLVNWIVPHDWLTAMVCCRPRFLLDEGRLVETERFSSMGNGYTFELESLIFHSIGVACHRYLQIPVKDFAVFGDDIAITSLPFELLKEVFTFCGFEINEDKSFVDTPFRESCGADWYNGYGVSPLRITEEVDTIHGTIELANRIKRYGRLYGQGDDLPELTDPCFDAMWLPVFLNLPKVVRTHLVGPVHPRTNGWIHCGQDRYIHNPSLQFIRGGGGGRYLRMPRVDVDFSTQGDEAKGIVPCAAIAAMLYSLHCRNDRTPDRFEDDVNRFGYNKALLHYARRYGWTGGDGRFRVLKSFAVPRSTYRRASDARLIAYWDLLNS